MHKIAKKTLWDKDDIEVGEFIFSDNGKKKVKKYIELKRKVVLIVPCDEKYAYLLKEYRPLYKKTVWRLVAGALKKNETPKQGAARELFEETGIKSRKLTLLGSYEYMGWVKFPIFVFKAENLTFHNQKLDFYEKIKVVKVPLSKAKKIALQDVVEPHHAFGLLKALN